jgi:hypothetical protein
MKTLTGEYDPTAEVEEEGVALDEEELLAQRFDGPQQEAAPGMIEGGQRRKLKYATHSSSHWRCRYLEATSLTHLQVLYAI